jgi:lysine 2,3-aminomutase
MNSYNSGEDGDSFGDEYGGCRGSVITKESWQYSYKNSILNVESLSKYIPLSNEKKVVLKKVAQRYHMRIPSYYLSLINNISRENDPIRKQCIPSEEELYQSNQESLDPLEEERTSPFPCLVHRYPDRVLLLVTSRCFMYCRHCTRKRLWKNESFVPSLDLIGKAINYIRNKPQIREVIVSGGDPLTLSTERLDQILSLLTNLKNIEVIRIGTRAPVVLPQRIDKHLCSILKKYTNLWINIQFNHPREITPLSELACRKLQQCGIPLSNQSVLLKGINDNLRTMKELCQKLQKIRVRPYYLFQCDPVVGVSHFRTSALKGTEIIKRMRGYTSGMCIPNFVIDGIEGRGKIPLMPEHLIAKKKDCLILKDYKGEIFAYPEPQC